MTQDQTPSLRFPEFRGAWEMKQMEKIAKPVLDRAKVAGLDTVLTLSAEQGIVNQGEYFGKRIAGKNIDRYIRIHLNDFVYNDRITKQFAYGTIKRLSQLPSGIVSPIYKCFRFNEDESSIFWEWYFNSGSHDSELSSLANEGARSGRFNISIQKFLSTTVFCPKPDEQQKITECLSSLDEVIMAQGDRLDGLKDYKRGLMQQLFPADGQTTPTLRFPEFQGKDPWEVKLLGDQGDFLPSLTGKKGEDFGAGNAKFIPYLNVFQNTFINEKTLNLVNVADGERQNHVKKGDVFFTVSSETPEDAGMSSVLLESIENCYLNSFCAMFRFSVGKELNSVFIGYLLRQSVTRSYLSTRAQGATRFNLSRDAFKNLPIYIPTPAEQQKIADCLFSLDQVITAQEEKIKTLKHHKNGLMQQLFPKL